MTNVNEAVKRLEKFRGGVQFNNQGDLEAICLVLDALAMATERAEDHVLDAEATYERMILRVRKAERERDEALAVIERVREWWYSDKAPGVSYGHYRKMKAILNTTPVDALRERDAEKFQEGAHKAYNAEYLPENPYRKEQSDDHR